MSVYTHNGLQTVVQLVQQWLSTNGRLKDPVVVQFMRLELQLVFFIHHNPKERDLSASEGMDLPGKSKQAKKEAPFFPVLGLSSHLKDSD